eukprot:TRINITY_DN1072_c0_g1_i5.p1 TRINITY_DN1072_c0_g1~~TRINITY_DN1072_c0_g1_i5.p1  ORF type:complete len:506 (-),score=123.67 TRINITY_DN1072_c0_g1_i5:133-1650(-)
MPGGANGGKRGISMSKAPKHSNDSNRQSAKHSKSGQTLRDKATVNRLNMYTSRPSKTRQKQPQGMDRIAPDRRWFGNTRVVGQKELDSFREELGKKLDDTYTVVMKSKQLPLGLLSDHKKRKRSSLLEVESYKETFSAKRRQKRPKLPHADMETLIASSSAVQDEYDEAKDSNVWSEDLAKYGLGEREARRDDIFEKGQSKRIWGELYKVIDSSDVVVQVLDARDPMGTRCPHVERQMRKSSRHKHLVFVLNKVDLVPTWVARRWIQVLSTEYPTLAFHASLSNPFGKGELINLLRQFSKLHSDKKNISVGFIGYPNVGKSSVINAIRSKKVCKTAPVPGETKIWQYITLMRRVFLIDCPGVVYPSGDDETDIILKGVVRIENLKDPEHHIQRVLDRVKREHVIKTYGISDWDDAEDFLTQLAQKSGRLLKKSEPDLPTCAKVVLHDWQGGRLPYHSMPPEPSVKKPKKVAKESDDEAEDEEKPADIEFDEQNWDELQELSLIHI